MYFEPEAEMIPQAWWFELSREAARRGLN